MADDTTGGLDELLAKLVPAEGITVHDCAGNPYTLRTVLPMRRQVEAARALRELLALPAVTGAAGGAALLGKGGETTPGGVASLLAVALDVAADDDAVTAISRAFGAAYPEALEQARVSAGAARGATAADLFPVEEVLAALVPLVARPAARALAALAAAGRVAQPA